LQCFARPFSTDLTPSTTKLKSETPLILRIRNTDSNIYEYNSTTIQQIATADTGAVYHSPFKNEIKKAYQEDPITQRILEQLKNKDPDVGLFTLSGSGLILMNQLIFIPNNNELKLKLLFENHDIPTAGHFRIERTYELLSRNYYFYGMYRYVKRYVNTCQDCQHNKNTKRHVPYGHLKPRLISNMAWSSISFDFILSLLKSFDPHLKTILDTIWVVTDRLTKYAYFIPVNEKGMKAEDYVHIFLRTIYANHGLPKETISDRGSLFASDFNQTLMTALRSKVKLSTAFHPQTDGQTE
jgi:hypothetical protein